MKYVVLGLVLICFLLSSCSLNGSKNDERSTTTLLDISALRIIIILLPKRRRYRTIKPFLTVGFHMK